jgi:hypothetical protein
MALMHNQQVDCMVTNASTGARDQLKVTHGVYLAGGGGVARDLLAQEHGGGAGRGHIAASGLKASPLGMGAFREPGQETPCATFNKSLPWVFHAAGQLSRLKQE